MFLVSQLLHTFIFLKFYEKYRCLNLMSIAMEWMAKQMALCYAKKSWLTCAILMNIDGRMNT